MCGRYSISHTHKEIVERFQIDELMMDFHPRFNVSPTQMVPVVIEERLNEDDDDDEDDDIEDGAIKRTLQFAKWGLIPGWVKDPRLLKPMINARKETIIEKPLFKPAFKKRRCLIPADGFYEWITLNKKRHPVRIQLKDQDMFAFAGLYENWHSPEGELVRTCTIITVPANDSVSSIHDRMPAILKREDEKNWLRETEPSELIKLLNPYDSDSIKHYRVATIVNTPKIDAPQCIEKVAETTDPITPAELEAAAAAEEERKAKAKERKPSKVRSSKSKETEDFEAGSKTPEEPAPKKATRSKAKAAKSEEDQLKINLK